MASPVAAQYAGPAVLARGQAPAAMATPQIDFRPVLSIEGIYDSGLNGVSINANGDLNNTAAYGVSASAGVSGLHSWKHTTLGLDYRAGIQHYPKQTFFDTTNQSLLLGVTHALTRHTSLALRENAGLFSGAYNMVSLPQTVPFDPATTYAPTSEFFDNRTIYLSSQADFTMQKSARLSFNFGADGFLTRRRSSALYGVTGAGARSDVQYRVSRRTTIGAGYNYTHFSFTGIFSSTDIHTALLTYATRLTRSMEISASGGESRIETKFVQTVPLDPAVAALLGRSVGTAVAYTIKYSPSLAARISLVVPRGVVFLSGAHGVTPGNGLFLTSTATTVAAGYTYTGLRRWSISGSAGYNRNQSIGNVIGSYAGYTANLMVSRQIVRFTHGILSLSMRKYESGDFKNYNKWAYSARLGIGFTPGDIPLRLW
jgi:hypothetical protein